MKTTKLVLLALLLLGAADRAGFAATSVGISIHSGAVDLGYFYDDLAPYGHWIQSPSYGWVWTPRAVSSSWRPYQDGHWVWTDEGWTWITDEPYGWATYHYGRWYDDPEIGWAWVPGYDWGPSWVSWQDSADYVGWAPLPPSVQVGVGFSNARLSVLISPAAYVFVPTRNFLSLQVGRYGVPRSHVSSIYRHTRNVTGYRFDRGRVYASGVPLDRIERVRGRRVQRYALSDQGPSLRHRGARVQGDRIEIFRPQVRRARVTAPSARPAARQSVVTTREVRSTRIQRQPRSAPAPSRQVRQTAPPSRQPVIHNPRPAPRHQEVNKTRTTRTRTPRVQTPRPPARREVHSAPRVRHSRPEPRMNRPSQSGARQHQQARPPQPQHRRNGRQRPPR
jgi:hypothetical protein